MKMHIKKGDKVKVLCGDDKGKEGVVLKVSYKNRKAIVSGINIVKKHKKRKDGEEKGKIIEQEAFVDVSNLMLMYEGKPTKVGRRINEGTEKKKLQRYCKNVEGEPFVEDVYCKKDVKKDGEKIKKIV